MMDDVSRASAERAVGIDDTPDDTMTDDVTRARADATLCDLEAVEAQCNCDKCFPPDPIVLSDTEEDKPAIDGSIDPKKGRGHGQRAQVGKSKEKLDPRPTDRGVMRKPAAAKSANMKAILTLPCRLVTRYTGNGTVKEQYIMDKNNSYAGKLKNDTKNFEAIIKQVMDKIAAGHVKTVADSKKALKMGLA